MVESATESVYNLVGVRRGVARIGHKWGNLGLCCCGWQTVGSAPDEKSFYGVAKSSDGCTIVPFMRPKRKFVIVTDAEVESGKERSRLAILAVGFCLAGLLSGCGSSSPPPPIEITTQSPLPSGRVNTLYNAALSATGGVPPYAWNIASGNTPPGLSLSTTGILSGTPSTAGAFNFSAAVTDSAHPAGMANVAVSITIAAPLQITTNSLSNGSPGVFYSVTLVATGGFSPYSWTVTQGALPNGLTLNATSGVISGTPTDIGTSSFTVQVSDSGTPVATTTANLSIVINPPPPRDLALYLEHEPGLQIQSDGSLTLLPSSSESAISGYPFGFSPKLPLLFLVGANGMNQLLGSFLVNPDYSLTLYSSAPVPGDRTEYARPAVDPTGSNLYLPGPIDSNKTPGVIIYPGNGSLQSLGSLAIPNLNSTSQFSFTPDGTLAFTSTCSSTNQGSILSYSRSSDGTLTLAATYSGVFCVLAVNGPMAVSPDGKYLATGEVQIYSIASDGTLTAVLSQPFTVTLNGGLIPISDLTWDQSSSFLLVSTAAINFVEGGVAVLSFSGSTLTETVPPTGGPLGRIQRTGSLVYSMGLCPLFVGCSGPSGILGFNFQNGQLTPLPGSPYPYGNQLDMVIY